MTQDMSTKELKIIRDEIRELRMLYKNLIDKTIPLEEPTQSDKSAIKKKEKIIEEDSLMKTLD
jgi:superfamily I DNA and/or RNA helicase